MSIAKRVFITLLIIVALLGLAAYFRSLWVLMCTLFIWGFEYLHQEFADLKERLNKLEGKLDAISQNK